MKTNDDKSVTDFHTKSVEDEAYNEKVVRSELLSSIERMTPAAQDNRDGGLLHGLT